MKASISRFLIGQLLCRVAQRSARLWSILTGSSKNTIIFISGAANTIWAHLYSNMTRMWFILYQCVSASWTELFDSAEKDESHIQISKYFNYLFVEATLELNYLKAISTLTIIPMMMNFIRAEKTFLDALWHWKVFREPTQIWVSDLVSLRPHFVTAHFVLILQPEEWVSYANPSTKMRAWVHLFLELMALGNF